MFQIRLDASGAYDVRWSRSPAKILALAATLLAFDESLAPDLRLPAALTDPMRRFMSEGQSAASSATSGETGRASAAERYRQAYAEAQPLLDRAITKLKAKYSDNLAELEQWGLASRVVRNRVSVLKPTTEVGWVKFLGEYVRKESSLEPADQLPDPSLAKMSDLESRIDAALQTRDKGQAARETGVERRGGATTPLLDLVQVAAAFLIVTRFDFQVTRQLADYGFEVVARRETF